MNTLALKLILTPVIIGAASLAGRRWGPAVSGWLIGLPLTSGPVIFFIALSHDAPFVSSAILGIISGGFSLVGFCLAYAWLAIRNNWPVAITGSLSLFFSIVLLMQNVSLPLAPLVISVTLAILLGLQLMPKSVPAESNSAKPGRWDLPGRILIGTSFIVLLTEVAPLLGPRLTGLLATIPLYIGILAIFAHRLQGPAAAANVLRGLLYGLFGFAGFFLVLALLIERTGIAIGFLASSAAAVLIQGVSLFILRWERRKPEVLT